jgi:hypothetical protein
MRRLIAAVALLLLGAPILTACGDSDSAATDPSELPTKIIDVTIEGSDTDPNGENIDVAVGQRIQLNVTADQPGEIHLHSEPEQEFAYDAGTSTLEVKPIRAPGQIEVESHTLDTVLLTLVAE